MPRVRFTVRRMMILVAVVALPLALAHWMQRRAAAFNARRNFHGPRWTLTVVQPRGEDGRANGPLYMSENGSTPVGGLRGRWELWNYQMYLKYERAARSPWLPVEPDPPEPE
jgi:hypothetical protein